MARPRSYPAPDRGLRAGRGFRGNVRSALALLGSIDPSYKATPDRVLRRRIGAEVNAHTTPALGQIRGEVGRRSAAGQGAITGYTKELAGILGKVPGDVEAAYGRQKADEEHANDALTSFLQGRGRDASAELAGKFQSAGLEAPPSPGGPAPVPPIAGGPDPALAPAKHDPLATAGAVPPPVPAATPGPPDPRLSDLPAGLGHGVAGESGARGYAGLSRLGSEGAAMRSLAAGMPGVAALGGLKSSKDLQLQLNREEADRVGQVESQVPGMISDLLNQERDRELSKAGARTALRGSRSQTFTDLLGHDQDLDLQRSIARQGYGADAAKFGEDQYQFDTTAQNYSDRTGLMATDAIRKANNATRQARIAAGNKTISFLDKILQPQTNALGVPVPGQQEIDPQEAYDRAMAFLRQQLPHASKNTLVQIVNAALEANGITEGFGGIGISNPKHAHGKKPKPGQRGPRRQRPHRGGD